MENWIPKKLQIFSEVAEIATETLTTVAGVEVAADIFI